MSSWRLSLHSKSDYQTSSNTVSFIGNRILAPRRDGIKGIKMWESGSNRLNPFWFRRNHLEMLYWASPVWLNDMIQPNAENPEQNWSKQLNEKHSNLAVDRRFKVKFISNDIIGTDIVKYYPAKAVISLNFIVESQELTKTAKLSPSCKSEKSNICCSYYWSYNSIRRNLRNCLKCIAVIGCYTVIVWLLI